MRLKSKIPNITILATTTTTLTAVANKIPNVGNLIKKTDYNTKLMKLKKKTDYDHSNNYITTQEFLHKQIYQAKMTLLR